MRRKDQVSSNGVFVGLSVTALLHMGMIAAFMSQEDGCMGGEAEASDEADRFSESQTIEASLAIKEVKPESRQPQKKKKEKYKPVERGFSKDENAKPEEKKDEPEHKVPVLPDEVDVNSILDKNRSQDETLSSTGADEIPTAGSADGSIWGTNVKAEGDPYVGELKGRIHSEWKVPTLETGGGIALGCVRLNSDGKIIDHGLKTRSKNSNLNRSVEIALKKAPDMEKPVPDKLKDLLTVKGICFRFSLEQQ